MHTNNPIRKTIKFPLRALRTLRGRSSPGIRFGLRLQGFDFLPEPVVFRHVALQRVGAEPGFGLDAPKGQQTGIGLFVGIWGKIADLRPAVFDERLRTISVKARLGRTTVLWVK